MASTYELIASQTLGSSAAYIEFTSIPATYTDLLLVLSVRSDYASGVVDTFLRFNGASTDTSHSSRTLRGSGAAAISQSLSSALVGFAPSANETASTFNSVEAYLPNYAGSTNKSYSATSGQETNATTAYIHAIAGLWSNTAAIDAIKILPGAGSWVSGSSAYLYGITKA